MSLAIAEKKQQQRPGGCAGIFFQLWEWNRRLAKKKLFSRKLLPPARAAKKAASKKFGTDEKMPVAKLLLIADENRGGFPATKKLEAEADTSSGMRAPGLVARLMGLESMPVVTHEKPRKAMDYSEPLCSKNQRNDSGVPRHDQDLCREAGGLGKAETRPPKLQKTGGFLERRAIDDERMEQSLFCKNEPAQHVRSKHHKLASPLKSPRLLSGTHKARLMQAATKILEPGMQSRSRSRYAITYADSSVANAEVNNEGAEATAVGIKSKELSHDSVFGSSMDYGYMVRDSHLGICKKEPMGNEVCSSTFRFSGASSSCDLSASHSTRILDMLNEQDMNNTSLTPQSRFSMQNKQRESAERKYNLRSEQHLCKSRPDGTPMYNLKGDNFRQNQPAAVRHTLAFGSKVYSRKQNGRDSNGMVGRRIFTSTNRSLDNHACSRSASAVRDGQRLEVSGNAWEKNLAGKRTVSSSQIEQIGATNSVPSKEITGNGLINRKERELIGNQNINRKYLKRELRKEGGDSYSGRDNGIVSFTFNSPMRRPVRSFTYEEVMEKSNAKCEPRRHPSKSHANNSNMEFQRNAPLTGNELSNLLDKKIKELTTLDQNDLEARDVRSTASILQELISALTFEAPVSDVSDQSGRIKTLGSSIADDLCSYRQDLSDISVPNSQMLKRYKESQKEVNDNSGANLHVDNDQPSPMSILEASFSNDSCSYRSLDVSSEGKPQIDLTESCSTTQSMDMETDLLDSATSVDNWKSNMERHKHSAEKFKSRFVNQSCEGGLPVSKLQAVVQALPNVELLFQNFAMYRSDGKVELSLKYFLLDTLETILNAFPVQSNMSYKEAKEADMLKRCAFDCMIQCLDSKYRHFCKSGYKTWSKLPCFLTQEQLRREIHEEVRGWIDLTGKLSDELIENELNNSTAKWAYCEDEAFETGKEIEGDILQALVNEMVTDFY